MADNFYGSDEAERVSSVELLRAADTPETLCAGAQIAALLEHCVGGLSDQHRELLELRYRYDLSFAEIGAAWGVSKVAVCKMHRTALDRLRWHLGVIGVKAFEDV